MRPLQLVGLLGANGERLRFFPPERAALVLPALVPQLDQEQVVAFYQEVLAVEGRLPRIEVDWVRSLLPSDRRFLRNLRDRHGSERCVVVIKVRRPVGDSPTVDLQEILAQPELEAFEHIVVSAIDPLANESIARLAQLTHFVSDVVQDRYHEYASELNLAPEGFAHIQVRVKALLNPVDVLEAVNALIDVQDENNALGRTPIWACDIDILGRAARPNAAGSIEEAVVWRLLSRMLEGRPIEEQVLLIAIALNKGRKAEALLKDRYQNAWHRLRSAQLIRNDQLTGWASWLCESRHEALLRDLMAQNLSQHKENVQWLRAVRRWFPVNPPPSDETILRQRVKSLQGLIEANQLERADEEVVAMQPLLAGTKLSADLRGSFCALVGRLRIATGSTVEGIEALRNARVLQAEGSTDALARFHTVNDLACALRDRGLWMEAEPLLREGIRLADETGDKEWSGLARYDFAYGLAENAEADERERALFDALEYFPEQTHPGMRSLVLVHLAAVSRDQGLMERAEPRYREALRVARLDKDIAWQGFIVGSLAVGLRDNGRWIEAEPLFHDALRLKREGNGKLTSIAMTMRDLAHGYRENGQVEMADALLADAEKLVASDASA